MGDVLMVLQACDNFLTHVWGGGVNCQFLNPIAGNLQFTASPRVYDGNTLTSRASGGNFTRRDHFDAIDIFDDAHHLICRLGQGGV